MVREKAVHIGSREWYTAITKMRDIGIEE